MGESLKHYDMAHILFEPDDYEDGRGGFGFSYEGPGGLHIILSVTSKAWILRASPGRSGMSIEEQKRTYIGIPGTQMKNERKMWDVLRWLSTLAGIGKRKLRKWAISHWVLVLRVISYSRLVASRGESPSLGLCAPL